MEFSRRVFEIFSMNSKSTSFKAIYRFISARSLCRANISCVDLITKMLFGFLYHFLLSVFLVVVLVERTDYGFTTNYVEQIF